MAPDANASQAESREIVLDRWQDRLKSLISDVRGWVEKAGWRTRTVDKPVQDGKLGRYHVPVLHPSLDAEVDSSRYRVTMDGPIAIHEAPPRKADAVYSGGRLYFHSLSSTCSDGRALALGDLNCQQNGESGTPREVAGRHAVLQIGQGAAQPVSLLQIRSDLSA